MMLLREPARPALVRRHRLAPWLAVATVCFGAFMGQLDASIVTVAFPAMERHFAVGLAGAQWVSLAYLLVLVALLLPVGRWSDQAGRKLIYLYGFVLFSAASAGCGLAWSLTSLIILRTVQAAGAAMLQANSVALVTTSAPPGRRRAALGVQAAAQAVGLATGPLAGGVLVSALGWRWIFLVNVPVGCAAVVAGWFLLPRTRDHAGRSGADPVGITLLAFALAAALVAVSALAGLGLPGGLTGTLTALAVGSVITLVWWEKRASSPVIDRAVLARPGMARSLTGALCAYMVLFGPMVLFPQVLSASGAQPATIGLMLTALPAGFGLAAIAAERILPARWTNRQRCAAGGVLATCCAAALAVPMPQAAIAALLGGLGMSLGIYIPANNAAIMATAPAGRSAAVGGLVNIARGLGTASGVTAVACALRAGPSAGPAMLTLTACALAAIWAGRSPLPAASGNRPCQEDASDHEQRGAHL